MKKIAGVKRSFIFTFFVLCSFLSNAQFFSGFSIGYAFPKYYSGTAKMYNLDFNSFTNTYDHTNNSITEEGNRETCRFNVGDGFFIAGELGYKINKHYSVSINFSYLNNYKFKNFDYAFERRVIFINHDLDSGYNSLNEFVYYPDDSTAKFITFFYGKKMIFSPNISYNFSEKKFSPEISVGVSISKLTIFREHSEYYLTSRPLKDLFIKTETKYNKTLFTPYLSLAVNYRINENLSLRFNSELRSFLNFYADEGIQYFYCRSVSWPIQDMYNIEDKNEHPAPSSRPERYNLNSFDFSIGLRYYLK